MAGEGTQLPLKYNTWVLKVPIHCLGCKREVKKLLHSIEGVYTTSIDTQKQQVTVTGNVNSETLIKRLSKTGKHAEICGQKMAEKANKTEKQNSPKSCQKKEQNTTAIAQESKLNPKKGSNAENKAADNQNSGKKNSVSPGATETGSAGNSGKTKKGKGQKGNSAGAGKENGNGNKKEAPASTTEILKSEGENQINASPSVEQPSSILVNQGLPAVQLLSYNAAYPSKPEHGLSYQVPSSPPYMFYNTNHEQAAESYQVQAAALNSLDIFSDENANGCTIM